MRKMLAIALALTLAVTFTTPALAIGAEGWCTSLGGTWSESDAIHATCVFPSGSAGFREYVGDGYCEADASQVTLNFGMGEDGSWHETGVVCGAASVGGGEGAPAYGPYGNEVTDPSDTTLCLGGALNGCVTFAGDQHIHKCTISPMLPVGPASNLPGGTVATLYVRLPADQGGEDTHTICFSTEGIENAVLYQYIAGQWVVVNTGGYGGQICTTHSGDGSFAMGSAQ